MMKKTTLLTLVLASIVQLHAEPEGGAKTNESRTETSKASTSTSTSTSTTVIDGKTVSITRRTGPDGVEHVTVTTFSRSGKPKVIEMTTEEFDKKYGPRKKKEPKVGEDKNAPEPAAPTTPGKATE